MSDKKPLLILHGALGAASQFDPLTHLLESTFQVYRFNFSGHGGRAFARGFSINQFATELKAYIDQQQLDGIATFGYSMGGYVALYLAKQHPKKIGKIFTLGTKFHWTPTSAAREVRMLNAEKIEEKVPAFAQALATRHAPNDWKEVLVKTKGLMLGLGNGDCLSAEAFSTIQNRVIIGIGSEDNMVTIEESRNVANELPNGSLKIFESFKHPIEQVNPEQLLEELTCFFADENINSTKKGNLP